MTAQRAAIAACGAIVMAMMLWPGDAPWGGDDVNLIYNALKANHEHRLIAVGLGGSFGQAYGPLPEQIYQGLLMMTHNPLLLARLHAAILAGMTAAALLWLTRTLQWSAWLAPLGMLSPFFWFYTQLMWDNTFAIPIGALLMAAYAAHLRRPSAPAFLSAAACAMMLPLIHPMTLPLAAAVSAHAIRRQGKSLRRWWPGLVIVLICAAISGGRYVRQLNDGTHRPVGAVAWYEPYRLNRAQGAAFPLQAGRMFSAYSFFDGLYGRDVSASTPVRRAAWLVSAAAYPLAWIGMVICLTRLGAGWRRSDAAGAVAAISIVALGLQGIMDALVRIAPFPHYFCGTWIACWVCLCLGVRRVGAGFGIVYAASLIVATVAVALSVHHGGGSRGWYGLTLGNQLAAAQELSRFKDARAQTDLPELVDHPRNLSVLRDMLARPAERYSRGHLVIALVGNSLQVTEQPGPLPSDPRHWTPTGAVGQASAAVGQASAAVGQASAAAIENRANGSSDH